MAAKGARVTSSDGKGVFKVLVGVLFLVLHAQPPFCPHMPGKGMGAWVVRPAARGREVKAKQGGGGLAMHLCSTLLEGVSTIENCKSLKLGAIKGTGNKNDRIQHLKLVLR